MAPLAVTTYYAAAAPPRSHCVAVLQRAVRAMFRIPNPEHRIPSPMRYIGNKTRLLPFILGTLRRLHIAPGTAHDAFAGTASVGRALKAEGWRVISSDIMTYSWVLQQAYVVAQRAPSFGALKRTDPELRRALRSTALQQLGGNGTRRLAQVAEYCSTRLAPRDGFMTRHFSPGGGRMYFTAENAARLDATRGALHEWRVAGAIDDDGYFLLLAGLIEGADRVANTAGVYAAYIKSWQPNALRPLAVQVVEPLRGPAGSLAYCEDAERVAARTDDVDLLYIDPPYNSRQYVGYYHVPEIIARGWFPTPPALAGRTGLLAEHDLKSEWCSSRRAPDALRRLLAATSARHVLVSYNSEGLLPEGDLRALLADRAVDGKVRRFRHSYRRYRADSDRPGRKYRGDVVDELLYYARLRA